MGRPRKITTVDMDAELTPNEFDAELEPVENAEQSAHLDWDAELVATLIKYPHIHYVYFDKEENWHFIQKPELSEVSREDILNG